MEGRPNAAPDQSFRASRSATLRPGPKHPDPAIRYVLAMRNAAARPIVEFALLGLLALLWGSSYLFIKVALADIPPVTLIAVRVGIAAALLLAVLKAQGGGLPRDGRTWRLLAVQAFLNSIGAWTLLAWGQQHVDSALAGVLNSTSPLFVVLIGLVLLRGQRPDGWKIAGAALGLAGVLLIVGFEALREAKGETLAALAVLLSAALYGGAALHGRRFPHLTPTAVAAGTMLCAAICLAPLSLAIDRPWTLSVSWLSASAALALAVLCTAVALLIYFRLVRTLGSLGAASQAYLRAGVSVLLGVVLLGERPTAEVGFGLALTIIGVAAINAGPAARHAEAATLAHPESGRGRRRR